MGDAGDKDVLGSMRDSPSPPLAPSSSSEALDDIALPEELKPTLLQAVEPGAIGETDHESSRAPLKSKLPGKSKKESSLKSNASLPAKSGSKSKKKSTFARRSTMVMTIEDCLQNFTMEEHLSEPIVSLARDRILFIA